MLREGHNPGLPELTQRDSLVDEKIKTRAAFLRSLGFKSVDRIIEKYPTHVLNTEEEEILTALDVLKTDIGLDDPAAILSLQPQLIKVSRDVIKRRFSFLSEIGFSEPAKMVRRAPGILGYSSEALISKIGFLKDAGILNPVKVVEGAPETLTLNKESMQAKIDALRALFPTLDASDLIMKFNKIITYSLENLTQKKKLIDRILKLYAVAVTTDELVSYFPQILSNSPDRLVFTARILKAYEVESKDVKKSVTKLLTKNFEDIMAALIENQNIEDKDIMDLVRKINGVKKSGLTESINSSLEESGLDQKIISKYKKISNK